MARLKKAVTAQVLWHTLAYHAKKQAEREILPVSEGIPVSLDLIGKAGGNELAIELAGALIINPDTQSSSSSGPAAEVVLGWFLAQLGLDEAAKLVVKLEKQFAGEGDLIVDESYTAPAAALLKRLRNVTTSVKRGSVRFEPAA